MQTDETEELRSLRQTVRRFVTERIQPYVEEWEQAGAFPLELFADAGKVGLFGAKFPEDVGGFGPDWVAEAVITEELHRCGSAGVANSLCAHKDLGCHYLHAYGSEEQRHRILPAALLGKKVGALAITEPGAGSDVASIRTRAARTADGWVLNGTKVFITNGDIADFLVVAAKHDDDGAISLFLVERPMPGLDARRLSMLGWRTSHTAELVLTHCELPADALLGERGKGMHYMMASLGWERVSMALGAVALADTAWEIGANYLRDREVFGHPLSENATWRQRFAQSKAEIEAARALTHVALAEFLAGNRGSVAAMAKLIATQTAIRVADEALQAHGGYGYSMELPLQRFYRDARLGPIGGGTSEVLREIIARANLPGG
ncbi:MAG: Butyryl-CoA dehydrogenase [Frankiales bacterium]|nr:Butyryl-CoA dehydrogenase [Frankiales bacterium]